VAEKPDEETIFGKFRSAPVPDSAEVQASDTFAIAFGHLRFGSGELRRGRSRRSRRRNDFGQML
jgi:hypothetical protein